MVKPRIRIFTSRSGDYQYGYMISPVRRLYGFNWNDVPADMLIHVPSRTCRIPYHSLLRAAFRL